MIKQIWVLFFHNKIKDTNYTLSNYLSYPNIDNLLLFAVAVVFHNEQMIVQNYEVTPGTINNKEISTMKRRKEEYINCCSTDTSALTGVSNFEKDMLQRIEIDNNNKSRVELYESRRNLIWEKLMNMIIRLLPEFLRSLLLF